MWEPINLLNKVPKKIGDYMPDPKDYLIADEVIKARQKVPSQYIAIFTDKVNQYDIDVEGFMPNEDFQALPYFKSMTKGLPHYFCRVSGTEKTRYLPLGGDLLTGQWSYCPRHTIVHQSENEIRSFHLSDFQERLELGAFKNTIKRLKEKINDYNYDQWITICFGILNTATENLYPDPHKYVREFSEGGILYDQKAVDTIARLKYRFNGVNYGSLLRELDPSSPSKTPTKRKTKATTKPKKEVETENSPDAADEMLCQTDTDVGMALFEKYRSRVIKNNGILHAYYQHTWRENIDMVFQQWISTCDFNVPCGSKQKALPAKSQTHKWSHYIKQLTCICIEKLDSVDLLNKTKDILPFQNGFYNFQTGEFKEYNANDIVHFTYNVNRMFPSNVDAETQREIEYVITDIFNNDADLMDEFFSFEARALSNHVEDKVGRCIIGERNCAKGFIMLLDMLAFVGVVGNVISGDLVSKKNSMESAERRNGFLKTFCENLLCISEEVDHKVPLDGTMWKSIASGGDKVKYRTAFGQLSENRIRALYTITCNKPPTFTTADASENMILCNMPCKYMEVVPEDECDRGFVVKQADPNVKIKFIQEKYIDAYTLFVLRFYKATKPKYTIMTEMNLENTEIRDDYVDPKDGLAVCVDKLFNITKSPSDELKCSEVHKLVTSQFLHASPQKIKVYLGNRGVVVKKNVVNYYKGITLKEEATNQFDD
ncbi:hypothetical protein BASA81_007505 [Batrachochytrium salamandrivorans]|nr:hypothetical protein BASA81_007505 [Batrachochytrium salamandrivorans]